MSKSIRFLESTIQAKSVHVAPNGRKSRFGPSARSAIWRRRVSTSSKNDPLLRREQITHASRPEGPASLVIYLYITYIIVIMLYISIYIFIFGYIHIFIYFYIHIYIYIYVYILRLYILVYVLSYSF